jgi:hypothetical protein
MNFLSSLKCILAEAKRRNALLFYLSMILAFMFLIFLGSFGVCGNPPIAEICYWLKPFKFSISFALYVFAIGWLMEYLKPVIGEKRIWIVSVLIASLIVIEMVVIFLQSIQHSEAYTHFQLAENTTETISNILQLISTTAILTNTAIVSYVGILFFRKIPLQPSSYLFGIRIGFAVFLSSCFLGVFLLLYYGKVPPDHEHFGLPLTQLSSMRNNLISLHFFGIHALQLFPLIGYYFKEQISNLVIYGLLVGYVGYTIYFFAKLI